MFSRIDELTEPPVIGKYYWVPTVNYPWFDRIQEWPVLLPRHEDAKILNFPAWHYHVDGRFLSARHWRWLDGWRRTYSAPKTREQVLNGAPLNNDDFPEHPPVRWCVRRCARIPAYALADTRIPKLVREAMPDAPARRCPNGRLICPHKGIDLTTVAPDADGNITCPGHGLRFRLDGSPLIVSEDARREWA